MPLLLRRCATAASRCSSGTAARLHSFAGGAGRRHELYWRHTRGAAPAAGVTHLGRLAEVGRCRASFPHEEPPMPWRQKQKLEESDQMVWWVAAGLVGIFGFVFALVPLYKIYCQSTGQGQAVQGLGHREYSAPPAPDSPAAKRLITIDFVGTVHTALPWKFTPQQRRVVVGLGETALAFYRAKNTSDKPIIGVSVYHMIPPEAGLYFNKIQCFCFDEQLINAGEEVDLPIFFFIDPVWGEDSRFDHIDRITLSYLFFESDSEIPEGYEDFQRAKPSTQVPPALAAPAAAPASAPAAAAV